MAVFPCPTKSLCVDPSTPFANLSAEAPDGEIYIGYNWGYGPSYPPLGSDFTQTGCEGTCQSEVSQEDADICAANQNAACTSVIFPVSTVVPDRNGFPAVLNRPRPLFVNSPQMATVSCPDGNPFVYTVPAGTFEAFNQAQADAMALSFAQQQAPLFMVCLGDLSNPKVCAGNEYTDSITASGNYIGQPPGDVWQIVTGALPPGITITEFIFNTGLVVGNTIHFTGICSVPGVYPFMLEVTDSMGDNSMAKPYQITVAGITNGLSLPGGMVGTPYTAQLESAGVTNPIYSVESGALPDGLSLDPTSGVISGTPTTPTMLGFTMGVTEAGTGVTCMSPAQIVVMSGLNFNNMVWQAPNINTSGGGTAGGTSVKNQVTGTVTCPAAGSGNIAFQGAMTYNGPAAAGNLHVVVSAYTETDTGPGNPDLIIALDDGFVIFLSVNITSLGTFDFPFTVPDTGGATHTIETNQCLLQANSFLFFGGNMTVVATLTPAS